MKNTFKVKPPHCPMPTITPFIYRAAAAVTVLLPVIFPGCCVLARSAA